MLSQLGPLRDEERGGTNYNYTTARTLIRRGTASTRGSLWPWIERGVRSRRPKPCGAMAPFKYGGMAAFFFSMVCSLGALKLCERHPVDGYTFCLASYYAIGTYSVLGAKPILGCISRFGRFTGTPRDYLRDLISDISLEIVCEIGSPISPRSGYCPSQLSTDRLPLEVCPLREGGSGTPLGV